ncbi:hypothetical protein D0860_06768 [Hortaea werneckii]|uniref:Enoyl reductase (ER) domain-containing protein n=1 Tax=Hortaea werneckii TaxID=91943 RepID=A0A3M7GR39_HORWE|nr:hypothetical protein D0860_06768 [Hortaea werneckii]
MAQSKFQGWVGHDADSVKGRMSWGEFKVKPFEDDDIDVSGASLATHCGAGPIEVSHCGVCGSDLHVLSSGWGPAPYPIVVGHEIVGKVLKVGANVKHVTVGDRVGVGAQVKSCLRDDCPACGHHEENHCANDFVMTYGAKYKNGATVQGGCAKSWRGHSHFAVKIPDNIPSEQAAPMLCGGVTTYSPLKRHGAGPGKTVGVVGIGGLGHFALLWAKALGADRVVAISRGKEKAQDVAALGAVDYIATSESGWETKHANSIDLIVETAGPRPSTPYDGYLNLLSPRGVYVQLGNSGQPLPPINPAPLIVKGVTITGSCIGSPSEIIKMLELASRNDVRAWVQTRPMDEANEAIIDFQAGKPRFRYCLVN